MLHSNISQSPLISLKFCQRGLRIAQWESNCSWKEPLVFWMKLKNVYINNPGPPDSPSPEISDQTMTQLSPWPPPGDGQLQRRLEEGEIAPACNEMIITNYRGDITEQHAVVRPLFAAVCHVFLYSVYLFSAKQSPSPRSFSINYETLKENKTLIISV